MFYCVELDTLDIEVGTSGCHCIDAVLIGIKLNVQHKHTVCTLPCPKFPKPWQKMCVDQMWVTSFGHHQGSKPSKANTFLPQLVSQEVFWCFGETYFAITRKESLSQKLTGVNFPQPPCQGPTFENHTFVTFQGDQLACESLFQILLVLEG